MPNHSNVSFSLSSQKTSVTELSPKYETSAWLDYLIQCRSFLSYLICSYLSSSKIMCQSIQLSLSFLNVPPTLFTKKGTDNSRMFTINHRIIVPTCYFFLIKMDLYHDNLHSYVLGRSAMTFCFYSLLVLVCESNNACVQRARLPQWHINL